MLIDFRTSDDAGVYRLTDDTALVQTVDFFTPVVDDPYTFGEIAAANSLSDVYAMGGRPLTALAVAGFPKEGVEPGVIRDIFRGGLDKLREAGVALLGGHTVQDPEIKFGYAVTGFVDPALILANAGAGAGDVLFLTKPIGTGIIATAIKYERAPAPLVDAAVAAMRTLNRAAADAVHSLPADADRACTDVTGFGLLGHASEMAAASGVTLGFEVSRIPLFEGVLDIVRRIRSGGGGTNEEHFGGRIEIVGDVDRDVMSLLYDPQTSGGLLVSVAAEAAGALTEAFAREGVAAHRIGTVEPRGSSLLIVAA